MDLDQNTSGENYYSYPAEYHDQIRLYKREAGSPYFAVFKIMDAVRNNQKYTVKTTNQLIGSDLVWNYKIKSPVLKETVYIKKEKKDLTQSSEHSDSLPNAKYAIEYQISIGDLFTLRTTDGILHYLAEQMTKPISEEWLHKNSDKFVGMLKSKEKKLIEISKGLTK